VPRRSPPHAGNIEIALRKPATPVIAHVSTLASRRHLAVWERNEPVPSCPTTLPRRAAVCCFVVSRGGGDGDDPAVRRGDSGAKRPRARMPPPE
jgi:hypothetical protein